MQSPHKAMQLCGWFCAVLQATHNTALLSRSSKKLRMVKRHVLHSLPAFEVEMPSMTRIPWLRATHDNQHSMVRPSKAETCLKNKSWCTRGDNTPSSASWSNFVVESSQQHQDLFIPMMGHLIHPHSKQKWGLLVPVPVKASNVLLKPTNNNTSVGDEEFCSNVCKSFFRCLLHEILCENLEGGQNQEDWIWRRQLHSTCGSFQVQNPSATQKS